MNNPKTVAELLDIKEVLDPRLGIKTRGYLFHGSPNGEIELLEPRQALHHGKPDGEPAVCAAEDVYRSIFISLLNRSVLGDEAKSAGSGWSRDGNGPTIYKATKNLLDAAKTSKGYLYLLNPNDFAWVELDDPKHGKKRELRSNKPVRPVGKIKVRLTDFPYPIEEITLENL